MFDRFGLSEISIASFFRNAAYAGFVIDPDRWPKTATYVDQALSHPAFEKLGELEAIQLSASIAGRRQALIEAGANLTAETMGEREPRKGIMQL